MGLLKLARSTIKRRFFYKYQGSSHELLVEATDRAINLNQVLEKCLE